MNKFIVFITIIGLGLLIGVPTVNKVVKEHRDSIYKVNEGAIIAAAKECYYKKECPSRRVTLQELYDKQYLKKIFFNPETKAEYSNDSFVYINKEKSTFYLK